MKSLGASVGFVIGGGTLIGLGVGLITENMKAFMFIGMGCGLIVAALIKVLASNQKKNNKEEKA